MKSTDIEYSIILPCLNEEKDIEAYVSGKSINFFQTPD